MTDVWLINELLYHIFFVPHHHRLARRCKKISASHCCTETERCHYSSNIQNQNCDTIVHLMLTDLSNNKAVAYWLAELELEFAICW